MPNLLTQHYAPVACLRLVQAHLKTQTPGSFYAVFPPRDAFELRQRFEPHSTPLKGAWLNRAEIAVAARSTQGLDRRIPALHTWRRAVLAWADKRNRDGKTVNWRFSQHDARNKLQRHYHKVQKFI